MNCQFCEDYEWSKKHRPKTGGELYWEDEEFSIGQDGMFYDNKYTEDGQA